MSRESRLQKQANDQRHQAHIDGRFQDIRVVASRLVAGIENEVCFTNPDLWQAYAEARFAAKYFAGFSENVQAVPHVGDRFPVTDGRVLGMQMDDGQRHWRIDWEPPGRRAASASPKLLHINWQDEIGAPPRYGANLIVGQKASVEQLQDLYWEIFSHYPNPFGTPA